MNFDEMLGVDLDDPVQRNADQLVEADEKLLDDLVALREELELRQKDVADRLGVDPSAIARIESGERDPHLSTLRRYALAIGAKVEHRVTAFDAEEDSDGARSAHTAAPPYVDAYLRTDRYPRGRAINVELGGELREGAIRLLESR